MLQFRSRAMSSVFGGKFFPGRSLLPCFTLSSFWESALPDRGLDLGLGLANPSVIGSNSGALALLAVF